MTLERRQTPLKERLKIPLMLIPALAVILLLFLGGLVAGLMQSLGYFPAAGLTEFTFRHYVDAVTDRNFLVSLWTTFRIAFSVTLLSTVFAVGAALILRQRFSGSRLATFLFQIPLPVPHLVAASAVILLFSQSGLLSRIAAALGLINAPGEFPAILYDKASIGVMLSFMWKEIPFIGLVVLAILQSVGPQYEELAQTLGATKRQRLVHVLLPLIMPGVVSTWIIVFAFTFANFEIPLLLGQAFPTTLPVQAFREFQRPELTSRPTGMAIAIVLAVITVLLLIAYRRLARYSRST